MAQVCPEKIRTTHARSVATGGWQPCYADHQQQRRKVRTTAEQGTYVDNWSVDEALRTEETFNSMKCVIHQNITKSREKALRLPKDRPRRLAFEGVNICEVGSRKSL